jgi:hypothetical protein
MAETTTTPRERAEAAMAALGLTVEPVFVPWSASRNAKEKMPSLNWKVAIRHNGRDILTTDYMSGCGHCAAYKAPVSLLGNANSIMRHEAITAECNSGRVYNSGKKHSPDSADVLYSLVSDAGAIDHPTFESWADEFGYDSDSRHAETIYRTCLDIALKLRAAIGDGGLQTLRDAFQDF